MFSTHAQPASSCVGLHYQMTRPQGKLLHVFSGEVFDVVGHIRRGSPTCGQRESVILSAESKRRMRIPVGFAHAFFVLGEVADFLYRTTRHWPPGHERCIQWNDNRLAVSLLLEADPLDSTKDALGDPFDCAEIFG